MITPYSKPIQNPYVPTPWEYLFNAENQMSSRALQTQQLKQNYDQSLFQLRSQIDESRYQDQLKRTEEANTWVDQTSTVLSSVMPSNEEDAKQLEVLRAEYQNNIRSMIESTMDNPYAYNAGIRTIRNRVAADLQSGPLSRILQNTQRAEEQRKRMIEMEDFVFKSNLEFKQRLALQQQSQAFQQSMKDQELKVEYLKEYMKLQSKKYTSRGKNAEGFSFTARGPQYVDPIRGANVFTGYHFDEKTSKYYEDQIKRNLQSTTVLRLNDLSAGPISGAEAYALHRRANNNKEPDIKFIEIAGAGTHSFDKLNGVRPEDFIEPAHITINGESYIVGDNTNPSLSELGDDRETFAAISSLMDLNSIGAAKNRHAVTFQSQRYGQPISVSYNNSYKYVATLPDGSNFASYDYNGPDRDDLNEEERLYRQIENYYQKLYSQQNQR